MPVTEILRFFHQLNTDSITVTGTIRPRPFPIRSALDGWGIGNFLTND
jgi:hypothetical protein